MPCPCIDTRLPTGNITSLFPLPPEIQLIIYPHLFDNLCSSHRARYSILFPPKDYKKLITPAYRNVTLTDENWKKFFRGIERPGPDTPKGEAAPFSFEETNKTKNNLKPSSLPMKIDLIYDCQSLRIDHPSVLVGLLQLRSAWGHLWGWAHPRHGRTFNQKPPPMSGSHRPCIFEWLRDIEFTSNFCREFLKNSKGWCDEYMTISRFWGGLPEHPEDFLFTNPDLTLVCLQIPESEEFAGVRMPSFVELGPLCNLVDKLIWGPILTIHIPDSLVYYPWFNDEDYPSNLTYMLPPRPSGAFEEEDDGDTARYEAEIVAWCQNTYLRWGPEDRSEKLPEKIILGNLGSRISPTGQITSVSDEAFEKMTMSMTACLNKIPMSEDDRVCFSFLKGKPVYNYCQH